MALPGIFRNNLPCMVSMINPARKAREQGGGEDNIRRQFRDFNLANSLWLTWEQDGEWSSFPHWPNGRQYILQTSNVLEISQKVKRQAILKIVSSWPLLVAGSQLGLRNVSDGSGYRPWALSAISTLSSGSHLISVGNWSELSKG